MTGRYSGRSFPLETTIAVVTAQAAPDLIGSSCSGLIGELRISDQLPAQGYKINFTFGDDIFSEFRAVNAAHHCYWYACLLFDLSSTLNISRR